MSLFKKDTGTEAVASKTVKPVVLRTENIAKELMAIAASNGVAVSTLDFNLLDVQTMVGMAAEDKDVEWEELSGDELSHLDNDKLLNPQFHIKQVYEVELFSKTEPDPLDSMDLSVGANAALTKVYLTIKPGSSVEYFDGLESALIKLVNKKKLRANLMINMFDESMKPVLSQLAARIQVNNTMTFDKKEMLLIGQGVDAVATKNDELIIHCEGKKETDVDEKGRVDHAKRGYLLSVVEGDLLIEYIKPLIGEPGRNCRGGYIVPPEPVVSNEPTFTVSDKIEVIDSDDRIEYRAKDSGYVTFEANVYDISKEMEVTEISFKTTGSIDTQLDAEVSINVKSPDAFEDAIGEGMEVEVNEINVDGNMGPSSVIRAKKAVIEGQTHQSAAIYADDLRINTHKGKAFGKNIRITRLEHGVVEGETVSVTHAVGGTIRAKEITIEILGSHVTMTATQKIEVQQLRGEENKFIIDPVALYGKEDELSENESKIREAKRHLTEVQKEVDKYEKMIRENASSYADLKKRLLHYKKSGVAMPSSFVAKYKQFQEMQTHLDSLRKELEQKSDRFDLLASKHKAFQSDIFDARVICHDKWRGYNEIIFRLVEPEIEISMIPPDYSEQHVYALRRDEEDDTLSITAVEE